VLLYSALCDGLIALLPLGVTLFFSRVGFSYNIFEKFQITLIWIFLSYIFAISIPTVIDRSLSFYILEKIQQKGGAIPASSLEEIIRDEYVKEHRLVDVRITEQLQSKTIQIDNGCIKLTSRGVEIASFSRFFRKNFLPKKRLLNDVYSDDLVDPFSNGLVSNKEYTCK
jgi:hypothetical protein